MLVSVACVPRRLSAEYPSLSTCALGSRLPVNQRMGLTGCLVEESPSLTAGFRSELAGTLNDELAACLARCGRFRVVDRTRVTKVLEEHMLTLSGLVSDSAEHGTLELSATDFLCDIRVSGARITTITAADDPAVADTPLLVRGTARCRVALEVVSSRTADVVWSRSVEHTTTTFADNEAMLDTRALLVRSACDALRQLAGELCCTAF